jgi:hypothetical protein
METKIIADVLRGIPFFAGIGDDAVTLLRRAARHPVGGSAADRD